MFINFGMMRKLCLIAFMFLFWFVIVVGEINFCGLWFFLFKMADPLDLLSDVEMEVFVSIVYKLHSMKDKSMLLGELGAQLSHSQRHLIREQGRLLSWLSQFPIFTVTGNAYAERVTLNIGGSEKRWDLDGKSKVLELTETRVRSVSEADVVALEDFVDTVLEHIAEVVEDVSSLRRLVDGLNCGYQDGTNAKTVDRTLRYRHVI